MKLLRLVLLLLITQSLSAQKLLVSDLYCEHKINPMGIDVAQPRVSWKINGTGRNIMQASCSIRVATNKNFTAKSIVWQSEKINSAESVLQSYAGAALQSGQRYYWQVKVWDAGNNEPPRRIRPRWQRSRCRGRRTDVAPVPARDGSPRREVAPRLPARRRASRRTARSSPPNSRTGPCRGPGESPGGPQRGASG